MYDLSIDSKTLAHLRFADDLVVLKEETTQMKPELHNLYKVSKEHINKSSLTSESLGFALTCLG